MYQNTKIIISDKVNSFVPESVKRITTDFSLSNE